MIVASLIVLAAALPSAAVPSVAAALDKVEVRGPCDDGVGTTLKTVF